ncbi:MAG: hypothetical protein AB7G48_10595 [Nitrospiraceae bacterium]
MRHIGWEIAVVGLLFVQACASEPSRSTSSSTATTSAASPTAGTTSSIATDFEVLLNKIKADKRSLVSNNMELTDEEAGKFWPLYDSYQQNLDLIDRRLGRTITDYAEAFKKGPVPDGTASNLLDEVLAVEAAEVAIKQSYARQFAHVLPEAKVARYLQIENKIRSLLKYELAREIPLID